MKVQKSAQGTRREFLVSSAGAVATTCLPFSGIAAEPSEPANRKLRAAIFGSTGRGAYGHELDELFNDLPGIEVVALADPDPSGRANAARRCGALRSYAGYRELLRQEQPDLVCVAPRWTDQHHSMALAALNAGAHVFLEKPITQTLAEADELLATAQRAGLKIAVAHQMRLSPGILFLQQRLAAGAWGELLEIRAYGKQDRRAGGEDLMVLGVHVFDLMRCFAGEPLWCSARVLQKGREITLADAHPATEDIGPIAGDEIFAQLAFPQGVNASFTSRANQREAAGPWAMELICATGSIRIRMGIFPTLLERRTGTTTPDGLPGEWGPLENDPSNTAPAAEKSVFAANRRLVKDWLAAIEQKREPVCSGHSGTKALEMAMAVFAAGLSQQRVQFPLKNRHHPLRP